MTTQHPDDSLRRRFPVSATFRRLSAERDDPEVTLPSTGTVDDDDDPNDEHEGENEAPERGEEDTELPEEFESDDEDGLGHPEDDDADENDDEDEDEPGRPKGGRFGAVRLRLSGSGASHTERLS